jgi:adenylate cyclase
MSYTPTLESVGIERHRNVVLLVDDQAIIGEAVRRLLATDSEIEFHYCREPLRAVETAERVRPTVILQDLVMPDMDGLTLVRTYRAHEATRLIPLVVLSTKEDPAIKAAAFAAGANDYLVKLPAQLELVARVRHHSGGYISAIERNEAFAALEQSRRDLQVRNRFIREAFGRFVSDEVVEQVLASSNGLNLGGETRVVTVMMADVRGFTSIAEHLPAASVVTLVNLFLETMTEVILEHGGTIDKFLGDGILAIFGAPVPQGDDAARGVRAAVAMQRAMPSVNVRLAALGLPRISMGIGLHTGEVIAGNIGSTRRVSYSIVGHNVNFAARVESCTVGGQVLASVETVEAVGPERLRLGDRFSVDLKGVSRRAEVVEVLGVVDGDPIDVPRREGQARRLATALEVLVTRIDGKRVDETALTASLEAWGADRVTLRLAGAALAPRADLRIEVSSTPGAELYAKVVTFDEASGIADLAVTAVGEELRAALDAAP